MRLEGTLEELNYELASLTIAPRTDLSARTSMMVTSPKLSLNPASGVKNKRKKSISERRLKTAVAPTLQRQETAFAADLEFNFHLSLLNIVPLQAVESRPLPRYYHPATKKKYDQLLYIQWQTPEIADLNFNIDDLLPLAQAKDRFYIEHYFLTDKKEKSAETEALVHRDVVERLKLYAFICKRRKRLRNVFISYNLENIQLVRDILSMNFATYMRLLKDLMLLSRDFDVIEAVKVFYKSVVHSKQLPDFAAGNEKKWLTDLLRSFNFETNYRLKLPGFIESLVRLAAIHPRFSRFANLSLSARFSILYKRVLKPNVRLVLGLHYRKLLSDLHVMDTVALYETDLHNIYTAYQAHLPEKSVVIDFKGKHLKLSLSNAYSLFGDQHLLKPGEIVSRTVDSLEADIESIREDEIASFHVKKPTVKGTLRQILARNHAATKSSRPSEIRFPSSSTANTLQHSERIRSKLNFSQASFPLLPFARPMRNELLLDRFELFSFFLSALEVGLRQEKDELFLCNPTEITDDDFVLDFPEFLSLVTLVAIHYWKTVSANQDLSLVEGIYAFLKGFITTF